MKSKKLDTTVGGYMQDWDSWIKDNNSKLHHPANFEERFVREILAHVPEITPQDIVAQYHFQELDGCNRYVDFCIRNDKKGYFVLIELDGKWKQQRLEELLERQNTLIASTQGKLLRFANSTWLNKAPIVIQTISNTLNEQNKHFNEKTRTEALEHKIKEQQESVEELSKQIQIHKANEQKELGESTSNPFLSNNFKYVIASIIFMITLYFILHAVTTTKSSNKAPNDSTLTNVAEVFVPAYQAKDHIGKVITVCGYVAEIKTIQERTYINLGNIYPNQEMTIVIWPDEQYKFSTLLNSFGGKTICLNGEVTKYKNTPQISLEDPTQIKEMP